MTNTDIYEFGQCTYCKKEKALKNKACLECTIAFSKKKKQGSANGSSNIEMPDFLKNLFSNFT